MHSGGPCILNRYDGFATEVQPTLGVFHRHVDIVNKEPEKLNGYTNISLEYTDRDAHQPAGVHPTDVSR